MEPEYKQDYDRDRDRDRSGIKVGMDPGQKQDEDRGENMTETGCVHCNRTGKQVKLGSEFKIYFFVVIEKV